jgi:hypothetical protein
MADALTQEKCEMYVLSIQEYRLTNGITDHLDVSRVNFLGILDT